MYSVYVIIHYGFEFIQFWWNFLKLRIALKSPRRTKHVCNLRWTRILSKTREIYHIQWSMFIVLLENTREIYTYNIYLVYCWTIIIVFIFSIIPLCSIYLMCSRNDKYQLHCNPSNKTHFLEVFFDCWDTLGTYFFEVS